MNVADGFARLSLEGRVAVVTGAGRGIGAATARLLALRGARVLGVDKHPVDLHAVDLHPATGADPADWIEADLSSSAGCAHVASRVAELVDRVDVVVHNAGVGGFGLEIDRTTEEDWDRLHAINVKAVFLLTQALLPLLRRADGAAVVNVSSVHAVATSPGVAPYAASKGALLALTRALAIDLAPDLIRVTCVLPGATATPMLQEHLDLLGGTAEGIGLGVDERAFPRVCDPEETAEVIAFLASPASSAIRGSAVYADGGMLSTLGF